MIDFSKLKTPQQIERERKTAMREIQDGGHNAVAIKIEGSYVECFWTESRVPGVRVRLRIEDGPDRDSVITWTGYLSERAISYTKERLEALGWSGNVATLLDEELNAPVWIATKSEAYTDRNGNERTATKVVAIRPRNSRRGASGPGPGAISGQDARRMLAEAFAGQSGPSMRPGSPDTQRRVGEVPNDPSFDGGDDIPF